MGKRENGQDACSEDSGGINVLLQVLHIALKTLKVKGKGTQIKPVKEKKRDADILVRN